MAGLGLRDRCRQKFKELNILTVVCLYIVEVATYTQNLNLKKRTHWHSHNTRKAANFSLPYHRLTLYKEKPSYIGMRILNNLPEEVKNGETQKMRQRLTKWLAERPFYTLKEFFEWKTTTFD